jgi:hypothetical protein
VILARAWQGLQSRWSLLTGDGSSLSMMAPSILPVVVVGHDRPDGTVVNAFGWSRDAGGSGGLFPALELRANVDLWLLAVDTLEPEGASVFLFGVPQTWTGGTATNAQFLQPENPEASAGRYNRATNPGPLVTAGYHVLPRPVLLKAGMVWVAVGRVANGVLTHTVWYEGA